MLKGKTPNNLETYIKGRSDDNKLIFLTYSLNEFKKQTATPKGLFFTIIKFFTTCKNDQVTFSFL